MALVPPPDTLSGCDPKEGQPEAVWKKDWGFRIGTGIHSFFQSADGSKGPTEGKLNEANFDNGSFTLDGMRHE